MGARRIAREVALRILFAREFSPDAVERALGSEWNFYRFPPDDENAREGQARRPHGRRERQVVAFAGTLVRGVEERCEALDALIRRASHNWRLERMTSIDRNVLRMGAFELAHLPDVPPRVTLNEAIELVKRYGTADSPAFVNGVLDRVMRLTEGACGSG